MIAIVAHDAGGAEILSSYARRRDGDWLAVLEGPARAVFQRKLGAIRSVSLEEAIASSSWLLSGTGWQSELEWRAIEMARAAHRRSVAFLDHWVNYRERFVRNGRECLPDEIWVGDEYAARIARSCFSGLPIRQVDNPYVEDIRNELQGARGLGNPRPERPTVLFVAEPVRGHALQQHGNERHYGYVEEDALNYFLDNLQVIAENIASVRIRAHPAEPADKYAWAVARSPVPASLSAGTTLAQDVAAADIVVGCESMAMVVALIGGKRVVSAIPPGGRPCILPHDGIEALRELVEGRGRS